eukprot:gene5321-9131_t
MSQIDETQENKEIPQDKVETILIPETEISKNIIKNEQINQESVEEKSKVVCNIEENESYKSDGNRWIILGIFSCLSFTNAWGWITFSPISSISVEYFDVTYNFINWLSMSYMVAFIIGVYPGGFVLDKLGLRFGIILGAFLNFIGTLVRVFSAKYSILLMTGQWICAFAQTFILGVPPKLSSVWFPSNERTKATTIGALANQLGIGFGFILSPLIVKRKKEKIVGMEALLIIQTVFSLLVLSSSIIFLKNKPKNPPSSSADDSTNINIAEGNYLKKLWSYSLKPMINKDYIVLWIGFGIAVGSFYTVSTLLDQFLHPLKYTVTFSGTIGLTIIIGGVLSCLIALLFPISLYKIMLKVTFGLLCLSQISLMISLTPDNHILLVICAFLFGFFGTLVLPICFELSLESTYPAGEAVSSNLLMGSCQIFGIILINSLDVLIHKFDIFLLERHISMWVLTFLMIFGFLTILFFTSKLKRKEAEELKINGK